VQPWQLFENTESDVATVDMMVNIKTSREAYRKAGKNPGQIQLLASVSVSLLGAMFNPHNCGNFDKLLVKNSV
jgi:hypothetical protein